MENRSKNILITGGSGLIGMKLTELLVEKGYHVAHLVRKKYDNNKIKSFIWNVERNTIDDNAFDGIDAIVHLAGAGIADKCWTKKRKKEIVESRVNSAKLLFNELKRRNHNVKTIISASGINYYDSDHFDKIYKEQDIPGKDFLADVVCKWEEEADNFLQLSMRVVKLRTGAVLSQSGGMLKEVSKVVKLGLGAPLGLGAQPVSWIHIDDICGIYIKAIEDDNMHGAYNATGAYAVTNKEFIKAVAKICNKPLWLPSVPAFALRLFLGEMSELVLKGVNASSAKIQHAGYVFKFNMLEEALRDFLKNDQ